jgi:hypothetical protein
MTTATSVRDELTQQFEQLDDESKLTIALVCFSQCAFGHRRFLDLGQMKHAHDYILTDKAVRTAETVNPEVVGEIEQIRKHMETVTADPPDYYAEDLSPRGDTSSREFYWRETFEEPEWYEIRHAARKGLTALESVLAPKPGPPPGADGPPPGVGQ